jgi:hypothetical protein
MESRGRDPKGSSGEPERSGGSDRLDAVRLRDIMDGGPREDRSGSSLVLEEEDILPEDRSERSRCRSFRSALGRERLEPVGNDLDGASSAAVRDLPLAALESSLDVDEATLAEVDASEAGELTPEDHVVELGMTLAVRGDPNGRDGLAGAGLPKLGSGDESPDEGDLVHRVSP